jgi:succinate dehydrogenase / fumarate reductase flavoprotein subunit
MERYAPTLKDLAPRDVVSRAILIEIKDGRGVNNDSFVNLDLTSLGKERIEERLPDLSSFARTYVGIDVAKEPIPVAPTCHYLMGGIPTDSEGQVLSEKGVVNGLFAAGECACISLHGANRLGTNSLLDLVVFARRTGEAVIEYIKKAGFDHFREEQVEDARRQIKELLESKGEERLYSIRKEMQEIMLDKCSVFRDQRNLEDALSVIRKLKGKYKNIMLEDKKGFQSGDYRSIRTRGHARFIRSNHSFGD